MSAPAEPDAIVSVEERVAAAAELTRSDPNRAESELRSCVDDAIAAGDIGAAAGANYLIARVVLQRGAVAESLDLIDVAARQWSEAGQQTAALRTVLGRMHALDDLGRHADAVAAGEHALAEIDRLRDAGGDDEELVWLGAAIAGNLGVAYGFTGRHQDALEAYRSCARTWGDLGLDHERAVAEANEGIELLALGQARAARRRFEQAYTVFVDTDDRLWTAKCRGHRAEAHLQLGALHDCLVDVESARRALDDLGARTEAARLRLIAARARLGLDRPALALAEIEEALAAFDGLDHDRAAALLLDGLARIELGVDPSDSLAAAMSALDAVGDRTGALRARVAAAQEAGDIDELRASAEEARGADLHPLYVTAAMHLADLGDLALVDDAADVATRTGLPTMRAATAIRLGDRALAHRNLDDAVEHYGGAHATAIQVRSSLGHETLRLSFEGGRRRALDGLVTALVERGGPGDIERAVTVIDADRSRSLTETGGPVAAGDGAPDDVTTIRADLGAAYSALFEPGLTRARARLIHATVAELETALAELEVRAAASAGASEVAVTTRQATVPDGTTGVVLHRLPDRDLGVVLEGAEARCVVLDRVRVEDATERLARAVRPPVRSGTEAHAQRALTELSAALLGPLELPAEGPLLVVADHGFSDIPFHALDDGHGRIDDQRDIAVVPSLGWLGGTRPARRSPVVVVGVADDAVPDIEAEVSGIASIWPDATTLLGDEATVDAVDAAARRAGLVHLACHGLHRADAPERSALRMADGWLDVGRLRSIDLTGAVVVLSACESGRLGGPEANGLARAALAAGATACVVSAWTADDAATRALMQDFHHHVRNGTSPAAAIRAARRAQAERTPHPSHWAAFGLIGDPRTP